MNLTFYLRERESREQKGKQRLALNAAPQLIGLVVIDIAIKNQ